MSTFGGIQQALSSLQASQYGLQVGSQNISNASTPGYTRQGVDLAALDPVNGVARRYVAGGSPSGVTVTGTTRLNDPVVDARARTEHARSALADTTTTQLGQIESVFNEPSDTGLSAQLSQFWKDWANVAISPSDGAARTVLLQDAGSVANTLNAMSQSLADVSAGTATSLNSDLKQANTALDSLNDLNQQIRIAYNTSHDSAGNVIPGSPSYNSLLDQRDQVLDTLASLVGGQATINVDGTATVAVGADASGQGGTVVVDGLATTGYTADPFPTDLGVDSSGQLTSAGGASVALVAALTGGSAAASVTTLTSSQSGVPHFQASLDAVAQALAQTVNTAQTKGVQQADGSWTGAYDLDGNPGSAIFAGDASGISAKNIHVVLSNPNAVAASTVPPGTDSLGNPVPNNDGSNALALSKSGSLGTAPDSVYATLVGDIGSQSQLAQRSQATQDAITSGVDALRQSSSGVNLDEEVSNMLVLQRTYQASSKVLSVMDSMLDTLINQMGVG